VKDKRGGNQMKSKKIMVLLLLLVISVSGCGKKDAVDNVDGVENKTAVTVQDDVKVTTEIKPTEEVKKAETPVESKVEEKPIIAVAETKSAEQKIESKAENKPVEMAKSTSSTVAAKPIPVVIPPKTSTTVKPTTTPKFTKPGVFNFEAGSPSNVKLGTARLIEADGFTAKQVKVLDYALTQNKFVYDSFMKKKTFLAIANYDSYLNLSWEPIYAARQVLIDTKIVSTKVTDYCNEFLYVNSEIGNYAWVIAVKEGAKDYYDWKGDNTEESTAFLLSNGMFDNNYGTFDLIRKGNKVPWQEPTEAE
jgi:hypothetical protein